MVLGNFHCQGFLLIRIIKKWHTALAVGAVGGWSDILFSSIISVLFLPGSVT